MKYFYTLIILIGVSDIVAAGLGTIINAVNKKPIATPQPAPQAPKPPAPPVKK